MRENYRELKKYCDPREPTEDQLLADLTRHQLAGTKSEASSAAEVVTIRGKRYRFHRGYWIMFAGYSVKPSIWPEITPNEDTKQLDILAKAAKVRL